MKKNIKNDDNIIINKFNNHKNNDMSKVKNNLLINMKQNKKLTLPSNTSSNNIIENMLKPEIIEKNNNDIVSTYNNRQKNNTEKFKCTNVPYKIIIKDHIVTKKVDEVVAEDIIVYKSDKKKDANIENFNKRLNVKESDLNTLNKEIKEQYSLDKMPINKIQFDYKESFIKSLGFKGNTYYENKHDFVDFYKKKQKEAEAGSKMCDQILHAIVDDGLVSKDELPDFIKS